MAWDSLGDRGRRKLRDTLVREQARAVTSGAAYWRQRFADLGRTAASVTSVEALAALPAVGERDVSPTGDPAATAGLVVHGGEGHFALNASGPTLRRAIRKRATNPRHYRRIVAHETRPTTYVWSGLGFRYPLASTRGDLDVIARAGARAWSVLGLGDHDSLVSALPAAATAEHTALQYAALAAGTPALYPGDDADDVLAAIRLAPSTVLAVASGRAVDLLRALGDGSAPLAQLRTVLLVGAPTASERDAATTAARAVAAPDAVVLAVHAPSGARVLWAECRQSNGTTGLHTYPDLDVVQVVEPETGDPIQGGPGELVLSQLGMRGSALLRWRTGDLVEAIDERPCHACGRQVPRVFGVRRGALVVATDAGSRHIDLRALAGALTGRTDLADWRVVVGARARDDHPQVVVHVVPGGDAGEVVVGAAADIRAAAGTLPTQLVVAEPAELAALGGVPLTRRMFARA